MCPLEFLDNVSTSPELAIERAPSPSQAQLEDICDISHSHVRAGRYEAASEYIGDVRAALSAGDAALAIAADFELARIALYSGDIELAQKGYQSVFQRAETLGDEVTMAWALNGMAANRLQQNDQKSALDSLGAAARLLDSTTSEDFLAPRDRFGLVASIAYNAASANKTLRRLDEAQRQQELGLAAARQTERASILTQFMAMGAQIEFARGDYQEAVETYETVDKRFDTLELGQPRTNFLGGYAAALQGAQRYPEMVRVADRLVAEAESMKPPLPATVAYARRVRGVAHYRAGDFEAAATDLGEVTEMQIRIFQTEKADTIARLEAEFERDRREAEIIRLDQQGRIDRNALARQQFMLATGGLAALALLLALLCFAQWRRGRDLARATEERARAVHGERERIAREIHDTLLQGIHSMSLACQRALNHLGSNEAEARVALDRALDVADRTSEDGRDAILQYRRAQNGNALATIEAAARDAAGDMNIDVSIHGLLNSPPKPDCFADYIAIVQEAVRNAARHGDGERIAVGIDTREGLTTTIRNTGTALDPEIVHMAERMPRFPTSDAQDSNGSTARRFGLSGMFERAERIGADLKVGSRSGVTRVVLHLENW